MVKLNKNRSENWLAFVSTRARSGVHITKNPNFDPISTFSYFHYKKLGDPNFL